MAAVELATGYVTLTVETSQIARQVGKAFNGAESQASKTGRSMGQSMAKGFEQSKPDVDSLRADVERAQQRVAQGAETSARRQEAAQRKVDIAQAKLNETTSKYGTESSQAMTAADRLATAQQKLETETLSAATSQNKLQNELNQSKSALDKAAGASGTAATKYAKGWKGVGQRIKGFLKKGVKDSGKAAEKDAAKAGKDGGGRFSSAFKGAIAGLAAGFSLQAIGQQVGKAIQGAGDLEQSIGAIDAVFKGNADQMHKWAGEAATSVGLSKNEFNELGTLIGAQLKNGGTAMDELAPKTEGLVRLGADLSSMFGGTTREAVEALSSALKGEMDPIEKYGISLNAAAIDAEGAALGMEKVGGSWDTASKQAIVMSLATKQSADAQGNFARESDTFAHKQQVMKAKWEDLTTAMGTKFLPVLTSVLGFITDKAIPGIEKFFGWIGQTKVFKEITGAIQAFGDAWERNDGEITSSGLPGFMERVGYFARQAFDYIGGTVIPAMKGLVDWFNSGSAGADAIKGAILGIAAAWVVYTVATKTWAAVTKIAIAVQAAWNAVMSLNPIGIVITLIAALVGAIIYLYKNNETARNIIQAVWKAIKDAIGSAVAWIIKAWNDVKTWITVTLPNAFKSLGGGIAGVWKNITSAITTAWKFVKAVFLAWVQYIVGTFIVRFNALRLAIATVFTNIRTAISNAWNWVRGIFQGWIDFIVGRFTRSFTRFRDLIANVFNAIRTTIGNIWNRNIKPVLQAFGNFITDTVAPAFKRGVDAIAKFWDRVKNIARKPVVAVVDVVYNRGLKALFNGIAGKLGLGWKLPNISVPQFAKGGRMKKGWKIVGEEGPELIDTGPGHVYTAKETKQMLGGQSQMPLDALTQVNPVQAHEGVGGWIDDAWRNVKSFGGGIKDWAVGQIGGFIQQMVKPIKATISSLLPGTGINELLRGGTHKLIDGMTSWAVKKDEAASPEGSSGAVYDGPLGRFSRPAGGRITSGFGASRGRYPHAGIDFAVPIGSAVKAMLNGVVKKIGWNAVTGRSGKGMVLGHANGMGSYYGHLSSFVAKLGQTVSAGQTIAKSGNTGKSTGPHLHAELWRNSKPFNYMSYLHDGGGYLQPGTSVLENRTRRPEPVLTEPQWNVMMRLAEQGVSASSGGDTYNIESVVLPVKDIEKFKDIADFFESARRTIRKGVSR